MNIKTNLDSQYHESFEKWLREVVAVSYDNAKANPGKGITSAEMKARLEARKSE